MLNLVRGSLQAELDRFFEVIDHVAVVARSVTKSAFCQARAKLHFAAFIEINERLIESFYTHPTVRRWHGLRLLAVDGSALRLPRTPEVEQWFGSVKQDRGNPVVMGRISALFDVLNNIIVHSQLAPYRIGEHDLALEHFGQIRAGDLVLFDRGYPAFWLFSFLRSMPFAYCMRITNTYNRTVQEFVDSGLPDQIVDFTAARDARTICCNRGISIEPIRVRLVRVELSTGEIEVLVTSLLDRREFPPELFADLYHQRWGIEEEFKVLKCRVEIENFTGKSVHSILQDFHARIVTTNLTAVFIHQAQIEVAQAPTRRRYPVRINFSHAVARIKDTIVRLFTRPNRVSILNALIDLLRRTFEPVRPGRVYPRIKTSYTRRYPMTYKRCG